MQRANTDPPAFGVSVNGGGQPVASANYSIYAKIESKDFTVRVSKSKDNKDRPYYDVGVSISASVAPYSYDDPLMQFVNPKSEADAGNIQFKWVSEKVGLLTVDWEQINIFPASGKGILIYHPSRGCVWWEPPTEYDAIFGWDYGWTYFRIAQNTDRCTGDELPKGNFWKKDGMLILNHRGYAIDSSECPCGDYALFALVSYYYDHDTGKVDYCHPGIEVQACEVVQEKIWCRGRCFDIDPDAALYAQAGYMKSCVDCYMECDRWDDNYEHCLHESERCSDCAEIFVYRFSEVYDNYRRFCKFFYGGCGTEPDGDGNYPDIFNWSEDNRQYMSGPAYSCIGSHWNDLAYRRFRPRALLKLQTYTWMLKMHPFSAKYVMTPEGYPDHMECNAIAAEYMDSNGQVQWDYYCFGGHSWWNDDCGMGQGCWDYEGPNCCQVWSNFPGALGQVNEFYNARKENLQEYYMDEKVEDIPTKSWGFDDSNCIGYEYYSQCMDWLGQFGDLDRFSRWGKIKVERSDSTHPEARGVVLMITTYMENGTNEKGCVNPDGKRTYLSENEEVTLMFGEEKEFSLCDNIKDFYISDKQNCRNDCKDGDWPSCAPQEDFRGQTFRCDAVVKSYVF